METPQSPITNTQPLKARNPRVTPTHYSWKTTSVNAYVLAILGLFLLLAPVFIAKSMNLWSTSGKLTGSGEKIAATGTNPSEIKGWMTIKEVLDAYKVPQEEFYTKFGIPADLPVTSQIKEIEKIAPGFSTDGLRTWLTERTPK
jgi:hypothetical protein